MVGLLPLARRLLMFAIFVKAFHDYSPPGYGYSAPLAGIQVPIVIGIGGAPARVPADGPLRRSSTAILPPELEVAPEHPRRSG